MANNNLQYILNSLSNYAIRKYMANFLDITFRTKNYKNLEFMVKQSLFMTTEENYDTLYKNAKKNDWLSALRIAMMYEDGIEPSP